MRITLNLASKPFVELRPVLTRLRLVMCALALLAVGLLFGVRVFEAKAADAEAQMQALKLRTSAFEQERRTNESRMRQPQNMSVLDRSQFLNELFAKKSFSWTAVMMDLERVLPAGVQVVSIEPQVTTDGEVQIRLRVSGERDRAVQLVRNLEGSRRFLAPRLANETSQSQETGGSGLAPMGGVSAAAQRAAVPGGVEFDILSGYNPLPVALEKPVKERADKEAASEKAAAKPAKKPVAPKTPATTAKKPSATGKAVQP